MTEIITATEEPQYSFLGGQETFLSSNSVSIRKSADLVVLSARRLIRITIVINTATEIIVPVVIFTSKNGMVYIMYPQKVFWGGIVAIFSAGIA